MNFIKRTKVFLPLILIYFLVFSCNLDGGKTKLAFKQAEPGLDLKQIKERGRLVAVTDYNSTNYFIYRGQPLGFQFELLKRLAEHLDVKLEIVVNNNLDEAFKGLLDGSYDIIANNLTVTKNRSRIVQFTNPHSQTRQVLVQRVPSKKALVSDSGHKLLRNQLDLAKKTVYVQKASSYARRLYNLSDEIGDTIRVVEVPQEVEELIELVSKGEIDYTVCDENVAKVNATYFTNLDVKTAISFPQNIAWAVRKDAPELLTSINQWIDQYKTTYSYALLYSKYFENIKSATIVNSDYYAISTGMISQYDQFIKKYSKEINWDWKLLASLIYQESRFKPQVKSWAGAYGLMQLMPVTANRFGVTKYSPPEEHIRAGVDFIKWLYDRFENEDMTEEEKIKFVLASYNVGYGHVSDARNLARKYGKNPNIWDDSVDQFLLSKSNPKFYRDPVVKYGYCRGTETYAYVTSILERHRHYQNIIKD